MKISFNPSNSNKNILDLIKNNKDIIFDLKGHSIFARGVEFKGTDTNTWRDIKINNVSIGSHTLDLRNGSNTTLTNTNGVVTINSTWRPVVDNLTSDSTTSSLSAKQGKVLKALIDGKSNSDHNHDGRYVKKSGDTMQGVLTIDTPNFGALTIKRNDDANGATIQFRGKSSVYGYIGLNNSTKDKQFLRWSSDTRIYTILDTSSTYISNGKGVINGTTITQVDNATNSTNSTNARKLVNWYSARPTSLNAQFGDGSLRIFYATSSTTEGKPAEDSHILHLAWDNTGGYDAQLAVHARSGKVSTRAQNGGTWQPWKTLAFTTDIPTSLKNPYALTISLNGTSQGPYDGSAAKNINITPGSIGAAVSNHSHDYLVVNSADDKSFNSAYHNFQVLYADGGNRITGKPANVDAFGLFKFRAASGWSGQMLLANGGSLYIRSSEDAKMTNTLAWKTILDSSNYSGILDSRYYTESEVNSLLDAKLNRQNLSYGSWNPRGYHLAADYHYNGGDLSISENNGKMYISVDGCFWQNEGQYRVLDTSDIGDIRDSVTLHQYLSATDAAWYPLVWGGASHNNTSDSTGPIYKSYDKLCWQTSSQTLYATNIQTNNIKGLSIGGGIYWNPNVESASDGSDAASITLVRQGVAGGTTLVLSQMNDTNDTIQFKTNTAARLYHNSYPILTTQNTYVSNNKGYINGLEITQVNYAASAGNANTLDGIDSTRFLRQVVVPNNTENDFNTFSNMTLTGRVDPTTGASLKNAPWSGSGPAGGYGVLTYLFNGSEYGTQMAWGYSDNRIYIRNRYWGGSGVGSVWRTSWDTLALTSDIPTVTNYYWANVKISASSSTTTSPTVHTLTATRVCAGHNPGIDNSISCSNWFRSSGNTGWYNTTYQGGWYMSDTSWIRVHNGVGIYTSGQIYSSSSIKMSNILLEHTDEINNGANGGIHLNYRNSGNVSLCCGGGNVGIGTTTPSYKLDVKGQMRASGFHHASVNSDNYMLLAGGGYKSFGGDDSTPIFLGCLNLYRGNDGTISSSFYCLGYSVPFTYTIGGNYCKIIIPDTTRLSFYIIAAIASVNYSGGGMDTWTGYHRGSGAWWLHCYAFGRNEVRVKGFCQANENNDSWWGGNPLWNNEYGANRITVCIFGHVEYK